MPSGTGCFHVELMSIRRSATKLKYLAASESAMDAFISDVTPGDVGRRLRELAVMTPDYASRAGPDQPDRRAHRLQPRFRDAHRTARAHGRLVSRPRMSTRSWCAAIGSDGRCDPARHRLRARSPDGPRTWRGWSGRCEAPAIACRAGRCRSPVASRWDRAWRRRRRWSARPSARSWPPPGSDMDRVEQARIAQRAENEYVGAPTGLLDQLASAVRANRRPRC